MTNAMIIRITVNPRPAADIPTAQDTHFCAVAILGSDKDLDWFIKAKIRPDTIVKTRKTISKKNNDNIELIPAIIYIIYILKWAKGILSCFDFLYKLIIYI